MRLCLYLICCLIACFVSSPAHTQWTTYQGNANHDGYVPMSLDPAKLSFLWQRSLSSDRLNPVAAGNGEVFVSVPGYFSTGRGLQALDAVTGETKWSHIYDDVFSINPPAYANGKVYIQTCNHTPGTYLWAYDADIGHLVYSTPFSAQWESYYAPTIYDNTVYIDGGYYGGMYAFDRSGGQQEWFTEASQNDNWTPAVDAKYAYVYDGKDYNACLMAVNRKTGELAFQITDSSDDGFSNSETVTLGTHSDAFAVNGNRLICFDLKGRQIKWQLTRKFWYSSQATVAKGVVYIIDDGGLSAIDELTGTLLWIWKPPYGNLIGRIIATKTHVLVSSESTTYAVNLFSHHLAWSYSAGGALALSNRALYITGNYGRLTAIGIPPSSLYSVTPSDLSLKISNPASDSVTVSSNTISLSGTASELDSLGKVLGTGHLASVAWSSNRGGSGTGYYDSYWGIPTSWSTTDITLQDGSNVITVTATDLWGNTTTASRTIIQDAPIGASIKFLYPSGPTYSANAIPILYGTASAIYSGNAREDGIAGVRWSTNHGGSGACIGTNTWTATDLDLAEGENIVTITATDVANNSATATINITYIPSSPGWAWSGMAMVSMPIIPTSHDPKPVVGFSDNGWYAYISKYVGYGNDPTHLSWFGDPVICTQGRGFWAKFDSNVNPVGEVPDQSQPKSIHLLPGWNLIGNPFIHSVVWDRSAIKVKDGSQVTRTLANSKTIVKDFLWGWNNYNQSYFFVYDSAVIPECVNTMEPWLGYWIKALAECDLIIPAP